jgi:hypothetical protein
MLNRLSVFLLFFLLPHGCLSPASEAPVQLKYKATGNAPQVLALYEAWFGHPRHIKVGYSSQDPDVIKRQIQSAKGMGITGFVVDWYGDREPFIDRSYVEMQRAAAKEHFQVAMMYDETDRDDDATDVAIADFTVFHDTYLTTKSEGHEAYLTYQGRPVIFIFPKGGHTNWDKVRAMVNTWNPAPLLIQENLPGKYANAFDGFYAWINPGDKGWSGDGSNWGEQYLSNFYQTMKTKYPDKLIVGGAWSTFDDSKASWGLNRHISARCGQTYQETFNFWRKELKRGMTTRKGRRLNGESPTAAMGTRRSRRRRRKVQALNPGRPGDTKKRLAGVWMDVNVQPHPTRQGPPCLTHIFCT